VFLRWHNEEQEGKAFTKYLSQISSQCVLKLGGGEKLENLQDLFQANDNNVEEIKFQ
jgi:hypothetical protein